ncbi:MAG: hypothetical protein IJZ84_02140 [Lachnospiraceae bacterium]|nr:hypothetical protein [Lachnospiraceae bacterium]
MKKTTIVGLILGTAMCLTGCGQSAIETDTLSISREGGAAYTIISDFSDPAYDLNELMDMAKEEVQDYGTGVQITGATVEEGVLNFAYAFDSLSDYAEFMDTSCFYGTVAQALKEGFKSDTKLLSAKKGSTVTIGDEVLKKYQLFVWNEDVAVRCDGNVLYYSENLSLIGKTDVQPAGESSGPYYVVYK